jgi:hypothetical protein
MEKLMGPTTVEGIVFYLTSDCSTITGGPWSFIGTER